MAKFLGTSLLLYVMSIASPCAAKRYAENKRAYALETPLQELPGKGDTIKMVEETLPKVEPLKGDTVKIVENDGMTVPKAEGVNYFGGDNAVNDLELPAINGLGTANSNSSSNGNSNSNDDETNSNSDSDSNSGTNSNSDDKKSTSTGTTTTTSVSKPATSKQLLDKSKKLLNKTKVHGIGLIKDAKNGDVMAISFLVLSAVLALSVVVLLMYCLGKCFCKCCGGKDGKDESPKQHHHHKQHHHDRKRKDVTDMPGYGEYGYEVFVCPEGAGPGMTVEVFPDSMNGSSLWVEVPEDIYPGEEFLVKVSDSPDR